MNGYTREYVASMLAEMARMVPAKRRPLLVYLIEMAAIEAGAAHQPLPNRKRTNGPGL